MKTGRNKEENCINTEVKGLKIASCWVIIILRRAGEKISMGGMIELHNIYACISATLNVSSAADVLLPVRGLPQQPAAQEGHVPLVQGHADQVNASCDLVPGLDP